ncbi:MAG: hypothetical protein KIT58_24030 [Planctomycetota bacterium]|nr:hypothetical protein [Planctomycetota bacterium]
MMTLVPRPLDRLRRLRPLDRAALAGLLLVALAGPPLAERAPLVLDPALCVALAWERGGGGAPVRVVRTKARPDSLTLDHPPPPPGPPPLDPWNRPFIWGEVDYRYVNNPGRYKRPEDHAMDVRGFEALSLGPIPGGRGLHVLPQDSWPAWQRALAGHPAFAALLAAAWLIVAWALLRVRPLRTRAREVALAALVALPAVPLAWLVASSDVATRLTADLPLVLPTWLAVALTLAAPCLLLALGVRLVARSEAA